MRPGYNASNWKSLLAAVLLALIFCAGCATANYNDCPPWPEAGPKVADELRRLPESEYPALWNWIYRLDVLKQQLDAGDEAE